MKKILLWVLVGVLCIISSGCNKPLIVESQTATETEVDVTVTRLIETNVTKNQTKLKYGYSYNAASGGTGLSLYPSSNSVLSTEYYAVLTDSNGKSYRFKLEGEDYFLLSEGQQNIHSGNSFNHLICAVLLLHKSNAVRVDI